MYAHAKCNSDKSAYLAAENHVERWMQRLLDPAFSAQTIELAAEKQWESDPDKTLAIVPSTYLTLPAGYKLWVKERQFAPVDPERLVRLLGAR